MKVIFLGAGAWGTAMAMHASKNPKNFDVTLWSRSSSLADQMTKTHRNEKYLPSIDLPQQLKISGDWEAIFTHVDEQDLLVIATPVSGLKETVHALLKLNKVPKNWVWLCKGLEPGTSLMPHQVIERELKLANALDRGIGLAVYQAPVLPVRLQKVCLAH